MHNKVRRRCTLDLSVVGNFCFRIGFLQSPIFLFSYLSFWKENLDKIVEGMLSKNRGSFHSSKSVNILGLLT